MEAQTINLKEFKYKFQWLSPYCTKQHIQEMYFLKGFKRKFLSNFLMGLKLLLTFSPENIKDKNFLN